jgi:toxin HigB-1
VIKSFQNQCAHDIFHGLNTKEARQLSKHLWENASEKLDMLHAAKNVEDLRIPPGNRLERLKGNLSGYWSIRINNQWQITFEWQGSDVLNVAICDYH